MGLNMGADGRPQCPSSPQGLAVPGYDQDDVDASEKLASKNKAREQLHAALTS